MSVIRDILNSTKLLLNNSLPTTGSNTFVGTQTFSGSIIPATDNTYDLGSPTKQFRDLYLSSASLYIDGTKVLGSSTEELTISTDEGQSIKILEAGSDSIILQSADGDIELKSSGGGDILLDPTNGLVSVKGTLQIQDGNKLTSSGGNSIEFGNNLVVTGSLTTSGNVNGINLTSFSSSISAELDSIQSTTGSFETKGSGIISGSSQITSLLPIGVVSGSSQVIGILTSLNTYTSSNDTTNTAQDNRLSSLESFSGSSQSNVTELFGSASNHEGRIDDLETFSSSIQTAISVDGQNVTIAGNFTVSGTQTIVDSTTVQIGDNIIELNGSGAANGGLLVKDATAPNTVSGSLLWDSTNDYWKGGALGSESKFLVAGGDNVVSGSSQITLSSTTGYGSVLNQAVLTTSSPTFAGVTATSFDGAYVSLSNYGSATSTTIQLGDGNNGLYRPALNSVAIATNGAAALTLASTGAATFSGPTITLGQATADTNVKLILNGVASKAAGIEFHQSGTPQWYIGNGIASEDNNFELYNSNGTMAMKIIKSTNAINFQGAATFSSTLTSTDHTIKNSANAETLDLFLSPSTLNGFIDYPSGRSLTIRNKGSLGGLTLASTGVATFSNTSSGNALSLYTSYASGRQLNFGFSDGNVLPTAAFYIGNQTAVGVFIGDETTTNGLYVKANGNTVVGGTTPLATAANRGNLTINGTNTSILSFGTSDALKSYVYNDGTNMNFNSGNGVFTFEANNVANSLYISGSGVGIGTGSPTATLDVSSGTTNVVAAFRSTDSGAFVGFADPSTTLDAGYPTLSVGAIGNDMVLSTSNVERMRIDSSGTMQIKSGNELRTYRSDNTRYGTFYTDGNNVNIAASVDPISISSPERIVFNTAGTERMRITSGGTVQPGANGTQDLGSSSLRWSTVYTSDLSLNNGIGDWTIVEGEDDLFIYNNKKGKVYKFALIEVDPNEATPKKS